MLKKLTGTKHHNGRVRDERFAKHNCVWPCDISCNGDYELYSITMAVENVKY